MEEKTELVLMVRVSEVSEQKINTSTGKTETSKYKTTDALDEAGIPWLPMPLDFTLGKGKDGKPIMLSDLGTYIIVKLRNGKLLNEFKAQNFRKPVVVDIQTILALRDLFSVKSLNPKNQKQTSEAYKN